MFCTDAGGTGNDMADRRARQREADEAGDGGYVGGGGLASSKQMKAFEEKLNKLQVQVDEVSHS